MHSSSTALGMADAIALERSAIERPSTQCLKLRTGISLTTGTPDTVSADDIRGDAARFGILV
jgi:hypothetical protein